MQQSITINVIILANIKELVKLVVLTLLLINFNARLAGNTHLNFLTSRLSYNNLTS